MVNVTHDGHNWSPRGLLKVSFKLGLKKQCQKVQSVHSDFLSKINRKIFQSIFEQKNLFLILRINFQHLTQNL